MRYRCSLSGASCVLSCAVRMCDFSWVNLCGDDESMRAQGQLVAVFVLMVGLAWQVFRRGSKIMEGHSKCITLAATSVLHAES
jgi:hypothetical protein